MCKSCEWEDLIDRIDGMVDSGDFDWAMDTLDGIRSTVAEREHCTDRQAEAVENIESKRR